MEDLVGAQDLGPGRGSQRVVPEADAEDRQLRRRVAHDVERARDLVHPAHQQLPAQEAAGHRTEPAKRAREGTGSIPVCRRPIPASRSA